MCSKYSRAQIERLCDVARLNKECASAYCDPWHRMSIVACVKGRPPLLKAKRVARAEEQRGLEVHPSSCEEKVLPYVG